jgi:hypothetical protein
MRSFNGVKVIRSTSVVHYNPCIPIGTYHRD